MFLSCLLVDPGLLRCGGEDGALAPRVKCA